MIGVQVTGHARIETFVQGIDSETRANISELLEIARQGGAFQRAGQEGISEFAVQKIVLRLGGEGIAKADLLPWLDNWIEAAQRELGRRTNEDEAFEAARQEAERRFKAGLENPSSALMDEFARDERVELERQEERKRRRLRLLQEAIRFDELVLDAGAATQKLRRMAEIEGRSRWREIGAYLFAQAGEYYERGDQKGENSALLISIAAYCAAQEESTRARSAPMGGDADESRQCAPDARGAGERDGEARGGGRGLSRRAGGKDARARSARLGGDADESRQCAPDARGAGKRDGAS
jgi:hypothetical protein